MKTIEQAVKKSKATGATGAQRKKTIASTDKFARLSPAMLSRERAAETVITRPGARNYSEQSRAQATALQAPPKVAVTFRMDQAEFARLRSGAKKIGAQPRDVVKRAISNCLDAYGVEATEK